MEDSDYQILVDKISKNNNLSDTIQEMETRTKALNLVTKSWEQDLENSLVYQTHQQKRAKYNKGKNCGEENKAFVKTIVSRDHVFHVIVAGEWMLARPDKKMEDFSFVTKNCEPLRKIGLVMAENDDQRLYTNARFFINPCDPRLCHFCSTYININKISVPYKNWCILRLRIFNGKSISNIIKSQLQASLSTLPSFMGIFRLEVLSRTTFGENSYKICGNIEEMIIFQKMSLDAECFVSLPNISTFAIEYPTVIEENEEHELVEE